MKKYLLMLIAAGISLNLVGCDSSSSSTSSKSSGSNTDSSTSSSNEDYMNLSLGQSYNDDGVLITVESTEESDDVAKAKIKIENNSNKDYKTDTSAFIIYNTSEKRINYDKPYGTINVKKGEVFTNDIAVKKDTIFSIVYSKSMNVTEPNAKWVVAEAKEEKAEKSRKAGEKARESYANLLPYPETVNFPFMFYDVKNIGTGYYETGKIKYKNSMGNEVKSEYRMWYDEDGNLTAAELDGAKIK
ncbi:MAG: hypothetical protein Q4B93_01250 [Clostridia bacterium]|nr:hypothetical protein [Clostridia bacterium]